MAETCHEWLKEMPTLRVLSLCKGRAIIVSPGLTVLLGSAGDLCSCLALCDRDLLRLLGGLDRDPSG